MRMISGNKTLVLAAVLGFTLFAAAASAQTKTTYVPITPNDPRLKTNMFDYEYVLPKNPAHMKLYNMFKEKQLLEKFAKFFSPIRLPERVTLKLEGCDGIANAYYFGSDLKVCYEYFEYLSNYNPKTKKKGQTPFDNMIAATVDVFMHELGHVIVELNDIPFFGREEDTADYIASFILLQFPKDDARRLILGATLIGGSEAMADQEKAPALKLMANTHSLPAVRVFNRLCMAYGSDPKHYADAVGPGLLPDDRAKMCGYEYKTNAYAFKLLVSPYVDHAMMKEVMSQTKINWDSN